MRTIRNTLFTAMAATALLVSGQSYASTTLNFVPEVGQSGKDVVWVPTSQSLVDAMLDMVELNKKDYLVDLGSGDGRTVIAAAKRGAKAHGIEYNPDMVVISQQAAKAEGLADEATFVEGDIFESDFSDATVVSLFLLPHLNLKLRPTLLEMQPGTRVMSNTFDMDDWKADETIYIEDPDCSSYCRGYKWIVPAKAEGTWKLDSGATLALTQHFQMLEGSLDLDGQTTALNQAQLRGSAINFEADGIEYTGHVKDDIMQGERHVATHGAPR